MKIPRSIVDNRPQPFQPGTYNGELGEVTEQWSEDRKNLELLITFVNNTLVDGDWEPGNRRFFQRATIIRDGMSLVDVEDFEDRDNVHFSLVRAATILGQLARALSATEGEDSVSMELDMDGFLEALQQGMYKGRKVLYRVYHRTYKRRDDPQDRASWTGIAPELGEILNPEGDEDTRER